MAADGAIRYQVADHIARITIDRPERRNALTWGLVADLRRAFAEARADAAVRVCVLAGAGDRAFCAGADLGSMRGGDGGDGAGPGALELHAGRGELAELFRDLYGLGKPT